LEGYNSCTLCITNSKSYVDKGCHFFPNKANQTDYDFFLQTIQTNLENVHFLTQNTNQTELLREKFGDNIKYSKVGMLVDFKKENILVNKSVKIYDFLFHNTLADAKGLAYFLKLAEVMNNRSFIVPYSKQEVLKAVENFRDLDNVDFISTTWDTGLKEILINSKVVINPSLWSAPVEGALLKSIKYNGCVAVVPAEFSFQKELPNDVVQKLSFEISNSVPVLNNLADSEAERAVYKENSMKWFKAYLKNVNISFDNFISKQLNEH
jgi:hypothetical protein